MILYLDTETYSETPITAGTYRYAADAEVMLASYAIGDGPVHVWDRTVEPHPPAELTHALLETDWPVVAHNAMFDRAVWRFGLPALCPPLERWRCSLARALAHGLPGKLDTLCQLFDLAAGDSKSKSGRDLIQLFCKPQSRGKIKRASRKTHPAEWAEFVEYARQDIVPMRVLWTSKLPLWNYQGEELALWHLDQRINDRGVQMDVDLARAAIAATATEQDRLAEQTSALTEGHVGAATQRDKLLAYILAAHDIELPNLQTSTVERLLDSDPDLPRPVRELLAIRVASTKASTSKYKRVASGVNYDGRLRGLLQFCGAMRTGRWAGRLFQPQNLPRPSMPQEVIDDAVRALKCGVGDLVFADDLMSAASNALRGLIVAAPGHKLVVADLSNIEGRDQAWLAGEEWKLEAFRQFDTLALDAAGQRIPTGKRKDPWKRCGPDMYRLAYAKSFGIEAGAVDDDQRQIGKVQELSMGYEGGVGAYVTMAANYNMDLDDMSRRAWGVLPEDLRAEAIDFRQWQLDKGMPAAKALPFEVFVTCDVFKRGWRRGHANIARYWKVLEAAAIAAVENHGENIRAGLLTARRDGAWLRIVLPSGRALCYPQPRLLDDGRGALKLSYKGINQYNRKWQRLRTYGGKLFENACQAVARDVMAAAMPAIEDAGYRIVLTVHDEVIAEAPDSPEFNTAHLAGLLAAGGSWTKGLPLAAAGFETYRYRKD